MTQAPDVQSNGAASLAITFPEESVRTIWSVAPTQDVRLEIMVSRYWPLIVLEDEHEVITIRAASPVSTVLMRFMARIVAERRKGPAAYSGRASLLRQTSQS